jgi:catechol 2,3-dioxygenase-like lactoylglutathione lyase family enzyme
MTGIRRAMPVVFTQDPAGSRAFYEDFLGFRVAMQQPGFLMLKSPSVPTTQVILAWADPDVMDPQVHRLDISTEVANVDAAHDDAVARGLDIVYPLTDEPWGIRRFFVREPSGTVVNVTSHIADLGGG